MTTSLNPGSVPALRMSPSDLPGSASIRNAFAGLSGPPEFANPVLCIAHELAEHHVRQWDEEDAVRARDLVPEQIAAHKRSIDKLNSRRVTLIETIDVWAAARTNVQPNAPLHTETLGSVVDRLAIGWVRTGKLQEVAQARASLEQLADLAGAYDDLVRDVLAGRRRLPSWRALKSYGSER